MPALGRRAARHAYQADARGGAQQRQVLQKYNEPKNVACRCCAMSCDVVCVACCHGASRIVVWRA